MNFKYGAMIPIKSVLDYDFIENLSITYKVNSFREIGWPDPFPYP